MIGLAGDVDGHRVLDAGCGSGPLSAALSAKGAIMTGFDSSPAMLEFARQRLGATADLYLADLSKPLPFADGSFDDVVSSLVLHYLEDWSAPLAELRRVLKPGGSSDPVGQPPHGQRDHPTSRGLLRHPAVLGGLRVRWRACGSDFLAPTTSRDDQRLHIGGIPRRHRERTRAISRHAARTPSAAHPHRREDSIPVLYLLCPRNRLMAAEGRWGHEPPPSQGSRQRPVAMVN